MPAPGDWHGLVLRGACVLPDTALEWITIEYAGGNDRGNLWSHSCEASVAHATLRHSSSYGLYRHFATMSLSDITYESNAWGDLY